MTWGQDEDEIVIVVTTRDRRPCSKVDMRLIRNVARGKSSLLLFVCCFLDFGLFARPCSDSKLRRVQPSMTRMGCDLAAVKCRDSFARFIGVT